MKEQKIKNIRKRLKGVVVSRSGEKTAVVRVERSKLHPIYKKRYVLSKKYHAHDSKNVTAEGDTVTIEEMRPVSKKKRWRIV